MKDNFFLKVILIAGSFAISTRVFSYDHYAPPTNTSLLRQQRASNHKKLMQDIGNVVTKAINKKRRPKKRRSKRVQQVKKKKQFWTPAGAQVPVEILDLLQKQYKHKDLQKKITVKLSSISIVEAVTLLANMVDVPIIVDSNVAGNVQHFNFSAISLGAALRILLTNNMPRLALVKSLNTWRVVHYSLAVELMAVKAHQQQLENEQVASRVIAHVKLDKQFKDRVVTLWRSITSNNPKYYLMFDDISRKIFLKGHKSHVQELFKFLDAIDIKIPQIRVEARVVLADKDFEEAFGVEWSGVYNRAGVVPVRAMSFAGTGVGDVAGGAVGSASFKDLLGWSLNFIPSKIGADWSMKLPFSWGNRNFSSKRLNLMLNAAENRNEIKTVMKPTLLVNSGEVAEILVGQELPQEVRLQETLEGQPTNVTTIQYKDIGLKIKVKPVIKAHNNDIFLDIFVESSSVKKSPLIQFATGAGADSKNFNYVIKTSRSKNRVLLKSGQTTLISGLLVDHMERSRSGVPVLKEIPVLGWFFQGKRDYTKDEQLLIFITPTLL